MSIRKFSLKLIVALIAYSVLIIMIQVLFGFADAYVQNQIALGQMQNSNEAYAAFIGLQAIFRHCNVVYFFIWCTFTGYIFCEVHRYIKNERIEQE